MNMNFDEKHSPNVIESQTRLQNSAYTTRKNVIFRVLCALFEQIPSGVNRDILKNPSWCGVQNSNNLHALSHLVTWIPHTVNVTYETNNAYKKKKKKKKKNYLGKVSKKLGFDRV